MTAPADTFVETRRQVDELWRNADPDDLTGRLAAAEQALVRARDSTDDQLIADAWRLYLVTLLEAEKIAEIDVALGNLHAHCTSGDEPACRKVFDWFRALRAILDGDPELAEALLAVSVSPREALGPLSTIRCFQGRFDELEVLYLQARRDEPVQPSHVIMLAWLWAKQDRFAAARGALDTLVSIEALPRDRDWLLHLSLLAEISVLLEDQPMAEELYRLLQPYPQRIVLNGNGRGCWGSTERPLGLLCRFLGRSDDAARHFTDKIALSAAAGAHPWLTRGQLELAEFLLDVEGAGSAEALRHAREGIAAARRLDYPVLRDLAEQLETRLLAIDASPSSLAGGAPAPGDPSHSAPMHPASPDTVVPDRRSAATSKPVTGTPHITVLGGFEVVAATGERARWTSRKASDMLCVLVAYRGRPVSRELLMEYLWPQQAPARLRNRLAVAISTVRRTLDPGECYDRELFISATRDTIQLRLENVAVDAESFLTAAAAALAAVSAHSSNRQGRHTHDDSDTESHTANALAAALSDYGGEAFALFPYAEWASSLREECLAMYVALLHAMIRTSSSSLQRADAARCILASDPYDERATTALADALQDLGASGLAAAARERFRSSLE